MKNNLFLITSFDNTNGITTFIKKTTKLIKVFFILIISITVSYSQNSKFVKELTKQIVNDGDNDSIKVVKITNWITKNIKFNTKAFKTNEVLTCDEIIDKKLASNQGYSKLFAKILDYSKIKNTIITGYYKGVFYEKSDAVLRINHSWNAVFVNNKWYLFDITLASGYLQNSNSTNANTQKLKWVKSYNKYMLFADINYFRRTHLPSQKQWQLSNSTITVSEFEKGISSKKKNQNYNYINQINVNYEKHPKFKKILKNFDIGFKENPNNISIIGKKYNMQAVEAYKPVIKRSVASNAEYKKITAIVNKLNKQASSKFVAHIRNVKKLYKHKATKNKNFSVKNIKQIKNEIKILNQNVAKRQKIISKLNKKNSIFLSLKETYEKNEINDDNKAHSVEADLSKIAKLESEYTELKKLLLLIKQIDSDTINYKIESINTNEDSVVKILIYRLNYEKQKTNFINNYSFNSLGIYNNINDSILFYKKLANKLLNKFNSNVDTSYFSIETKLKLLVKQADSHYKKAKTIIKSKKIDNLIFALFNNIIDSVYKNAQIVLVANTKSYKPMIKHLNKEFFSINKNILSELENQQKAEYERYNNFNKYYNLLMGNEINLYNSFIEKCNKRITKSYIDYKKEGADYIGEVKNIFIE